MLTSKCHTNSDGTVDIVLQDDNSPDEIEIPDCNEQDRRNFIIALREIADIHEAFEDS